MDGRTTSAITLLNDFRDAYTAQRDGTGRKLVAGTPPTEWSDPIADKRLETARARMKIALDEIAPQWRSQLANKPWHQSEDAFLDKLAVDQIAALTDRNEIREALRGDADEIVAETLHPWVWTADVARRWHKGEYADAVDEASKSVNHHVQNKVGRPDLGETKLFQLVYGQGTASPQTPRLVFGDPNPSIERDRRQGAMQLSAGWFTAVRNLLAHLAGIDLEKYRALEYLAALSIIARWSDEATVDDGVNAT